MNKDELINYIKACIHDAEWADNSWIDVPVDMLRTALCLLEEQDYALKSFGLDIKLALPKIYDKNDLIVRHIHYPSTSYWCEFRYGAEPQMVSIKEIYEWLKAEDVKKDHHIYGKTWRVWSIVPSEEQMKKEEWK